MQYSDLNFSLDHFFEKDMYFIKNKKSWVTSTTQTEHNDQVSEADEARS
jgi:hypothetical protein